MPKIIIAEELTYLTEGVSEVSVGAGTVKEGLFTLFSTYPQLYVFLVDNHGVESQRVLLILNDDELLEYSDSNKILVESDELLLFYGIPSGEYGAAIGAIASVLATSMSTAAATAIATALVNTIISIAISMAISAIIGALVDDVATPDSTMASNSPSYTFDGVKNTTASGTPLGIVYGKHRTGGQVLSLFVEHTVVGSTTAGTGNSPYSYQTYLLYQLGLSEGEVAEILTADIEINKLPVTYFNGISFQTRSGTREQTSMPEFNKITNTTSLARKVLWIPPPTPATAVAGTTVPVYGAYYDGAVKEGPCHFVNV